MSFCSLVSPNTNEKHTRRYLWTLHTPELPREVYLSTRIFSLACSSSFNLRSTRCAFPFAIQTSGFPLLSFNSDHLLIIQGLAIWIIRCAASCWASSSLVRMACIKLLTAEYSALAPCISITVSSSWSSRAPETSHIVRKHQSYSEWNRGVAETWSLNPMLAFVAICQPILFLVLYRWNSSKIPKL